MIKQSLLLLSDRIGNDIQSCSSLNDGKMFRVIPFLNDHDTRIIHDRVENYTRSHVP